MLATLKKPKTAWPHKSWSRDPDDLKMSVHALTVGMLTLCQVPQQSESGACGWPSSVEKWKGVETWFKLYISNNCWLAYQI